MVTTAPILPSSPVSSGPSSSSSNAVTTGRARTKGTPMRSRTGCLTCRARKLKCDEQKPQCGQCRKGSRECRPSEGIVFRHQQNASMNKDNGDQGQGSQKSFYNNKQSFADDSVWLEIPKNVVFVDSSGSRTQGSDGESQAARASSEIRPHRDDWRPEHDYRTSNDTEPHGLAALSTVATQNEYIFTGSPAVDRSGAPTDDVSFSHSDIPTSAASVPPSGGPQGTMAQSPHSSSLPPSNNHNIDFLLNPSSSISPPVNSRLQDSQERRGSPFVPVPISSHTSARESQMNENVELDHEVAFLLRHYSEGPGYWMDLFDLNQYFSWHVPIKALSNPLLKYAACAYAAKQLGRVNGAKPIVGGLCSQQASMELWPNADKVDWVWYGAKYYDKAIHLLMKELQHDAEGPTTLSTAEAFGQWQAAELCEDGENARKRRRRNSNSRLSSAHSDEVLSATAILSVYEFLDATGPAWNRHLSGVKSLLDITEVGMMPLESQTSPNGSVIPMKRPGLSKARRAVFWNFARQDYLAAFINECQTRLDTEDLVIWTEAGLQIDANGFVRPSNAGHLEDDSAMKEDMISNALVWILSKIVNFIAMGGMGQTPLAYSQQTLLERWYRIHAELDAWYNGLPATFRPCARIEPSRRPKELGGFDDCTFPEVWYSIPMCASTMQHYHLARILLLINKPHESTGRRTTVTNRLQSYRSIENEVRYHSREIVGISLGRLDATARIHALQPLYVSGQCLTEPHERRLIIKLLRGIEADTGWATEYRVKQLLEEWGWTEFPTT